MVRTVIHLASEELAWLRRKAKTDRVSPEKLVRGAIQRLVRSKRCKKTKKVTDLF